MSERLLLSNSIRKVPTDSQVRWSGERLIEQPWLQLMCCTPVFGRGLVMYFRVIEVVKIEVLKEITEGVRVDKTRLGLDNVNLQTEEIHYNYSVFIESVE